MPKLDKIEAELRASDLRREDPFDQSAKELLEAIRTATVGVLECTPSAVTAQEK
jgi:hypothetical protein